MQISKTTISDKSKRNAYALQTSNNSFRNRFPYRRDIYEPLNRTNSRIVLRMVEQTLVPFLYSEIGISWIMDVRIVQNLHQMIAQASMFHLVIVSCNYDICSLQYRDFKIENKYDETRVKSAIQSSVSQRLAQEFLIVHLAKVKIKNRNSNSNYRNDWIFDVPIIDTVYRNRQYLCN